MVVVSDDVHEYAVALKDTEEKITRCPERVSTKLALCIHPRLACQLSAHLFVGSGILHVFAFLC